MNGTDDTEVEFFNGTARRSRRPTSSQPTATARPGNRYNRHRFRCPGSTSPLLGRTEQGTLSYQQPAVQRTPIRHTRCGCGRASVLRNLPAPRFPMAHSPRRPLAAEALEDRTAPALLVNSIDDGDADDVVRVGDTLTYTVAFNGDVQAVTVGAADFDNAGTAPVLIGTPTESPQGTVRVPVTPTGPGSLRLRLPVGATITDTGGDSLLPPVTDDTLVAVVSRQMAGQTEGETGAAAVNNTPATATPLAGPAVRVRGNVYTGGDLDYYSFTAPAGARVYAATMTAADASASGDTILTLFDTDGATVLEVDDNDGTFTGFSSGIAGRSIAAAGTYFLQVRQATTGTVRPYDLYVEVQGGSPAAEAEPNDAAATAQPLPLSGHVSGATASAADADVYSVSLNAGDTIFLSLDLDPERDGTTWNGSLGLNATVFGAALLANDASVTSPNSESLFVTVKDAGTYFVEVRSLAAFGTYGLSASVIPPAPTAATTYTSTDVPVAIPTGPGIVSSTLTVPDDVRVGQLKVLINLTHAFMQDLDVQLTAPDGNTVGLFTDVGGNVTGGPFTSMDLILDDTAATPVGLFGQVTAGVVVRPESNALLDWFRGQKAQGTWTLTLRDDATTDGGTLNSWGLLIVPEAPPPAGTPVTHYATDFEANDGGFTHSGTADEWELGTPSAAPIATAASGTRAWKTDLDNTYDLSSNQDLFSPTIDLTGVGAGSRVLFEWAMSYQMESASFDHAFVEVQEVGGGGAVSRVWEWLGATMTQGVGNPLVSIQEAAGWGRYRQDVTDFAGKQVRLRFHLDSDNSVHLGGLAIDDVSVTEYANRVSVTAPPAEFENAGFPLAFTFTRTGDLTAALTVNFSATTTAALGSDYSVGGADSFDGSTGTVTFAAGNSTALVAVFPIADGLVEPDEDFTLAVAAGAGYTPEGGPVTTSILNDDTAPVITPGQTFTVSETAPAGTQVGTAVGSDVDPGNVLQDWQIAAGNDDGVFAIDPGTGAITVADPAGLDFETMPAYTLTLYATDGVNAAATETVVVTLGNEPELLGPVRPVAAGGAPDGSVQLIAPDGTPTPVAPLGRTNTATRTATADVNGDGTADLVAVTGPGVPLRVTVLSGADGSSLVVPFDPFGGDFTGGGYVAAGDLDGDGRAEFVVTPDEGGGPRVTIFTRNADGTTSVRSNFLGIDDDNFRGGARAAVGDVNGDGVPDVVVAAGFGGGPRTAIFSGQSVLAGAPARLVGDFFAFPGDDAVNLRNGSFVAAGDVTGDGFADLVFGGGPGGAPRVFILSGALVSAGNVAGAQAAPVANFFVGGDLDDRGGARVAVTNADGDARADVAIGSGAGRPARVRVYLGKDFAGGGEPASTGYDVVGGVVLPGGVYVG